MLFEPIEMALSDINYDETKILSNSYHSMSIVGRSTLCVAAATAIAAAVSILTRVKFTSVFENKGARDTGSQMYRIVLKPKSKYEICRQNNNSNNGQWKPDTFGLNQFLWITCQSGNLKKKKEKNTETYD